MMEPMKRARIFVGFDPSPAGYRPDWLKFTATAADAHKAYRADAANAARMLPAWAYHRDWLNAYALDRLPAVCAAVGTGSAVCQSDHPDWWPEDEPGRVLMLRATPSAFHPLMIDRASGFWMEPKLALQGPDLISLIEKRLGLSPAKAAWRLARVCGLKRPMP
jgi:hypothetical protein